jgi:hypothetical protein
MLLRKAILASLAAGLVSLSAGGAPAQETIQVKGEIVDLACYLSQGKRGPEHKSCAQMCAKGGVPLGVLTPNDELYLLVDDHANPKPYEAAKKLAGTNAEISGKKFVRHGMAGIVVTSASAE